MMDKNGNSCGHKLAELGTPEYALAICLLDSEL